MKKKITFSYAETWSLGHSTTLHPNQSALNGQQLACGCSRTAFCRNHSDDTPHERLTQNGKRLTPEIERITECLKQGGYDSPYASINLPADAQLRAQVKQLVDEKKKLNPTMLIVIGVGGSDLGTRAVHEALHGVYYNNHNPELQVYFVETVDSDVVYDIVLLVEQELEKNNTVLINVISKSGTTTETIANFEVFLYLLRKAYGKMYHPFVVVTTDEGSALWQYAQQEQFSCLSIPKLVGGRYSVFSAVGLFPLAMLGVAIDELHAGAQSILADCVNPDLFQNPAALGATILDLQQEESFYAYNVFIFSVDMEYVGKWYRQLVAESLGKNTKTVSKFDDEGVAKEDKWSEGMEPTISIGSTDLHSVLQFYLEGAFYGYTTFVTVEHQKSDVVVPKFPEFEPLVSHIQGKSLSTIMQAIFDGVTAAYSVPRKYPQESLPYTIVSIPEKSAYYIGQFMQYKMMETIYLAFLWDVNPFDQPAVELYKQITRRLLAER